LTATAAAARVRPFAEKMAAEAAALERAALSDGKDATGRVRVATTEAMAMVLVEHGLLALPERHPRLMVELAAGNQPVDMLRGEADLALRVSPLRHDSLRVRCVARLKVALFAAPAYLERRGRPRTPERLRGHDVLVPAGELVQLPEARWLAERPGVNIVFRSNSVPALRSAAVAGLGIVPLTAPWGDLEGRLERLQYLDKVPQRAFWLVTPPAAETRAAVRIVAERIVAIFAKLQAGP
jgi:DNA-binding transcriptional LysR family regulator